MKHLPSRKFLRRHGRFELKYLLTYDQACRIRERLSHFTVLDDYARARGYYVNNSLYYDTPTFIEYAEYVNGERRRRKIRLRRYDLSCSSVNFEIKHKLNRVIWKDRERIDMRRAVRLIQNPWDFIDEADMGSIAQQIIPRNYEPKATVVYQRMPLTDIVSGGVRITFDYNIRCGFAEMFDRPLTINDLRVLPPGFEILEIKFQSTVPHWCQKAIKDFRLSPVTYSKYAQAIERLYNKNSITTGPDRHG